MGNNKKTDGSNELSDRANRILDTVKEGYIELNNSLLVVFANKAAESLLGVDRLPGLYITEAVADFARGNLLDALKAAVSEKRESHDLVLLLSTEGTSRSLRIMPLAEGCLIIISEQGNKEAGLPHMDGGALPAFIWVGNPDGKNMFLSSSWNDYSGQSDGESKHDGWMGKLHPDDVSPLMALWEKSKQTGDIYEGEVRYLRKDGQYRWHKFRALPHKDEQGKITAWYGVSLDIDDAKKAAAKLKSDHDGIQLQLDGQTKELHEGRQLLQDVIDVPNLGIAMFRAVRGEAGEIADFRYELINKKILEECGADVAGKLISEIKNDGVPELSRLRDVVVSGKRNSYIRSDGSGQDERWYLFSNAPLDSERVVQIWEDITELKRAEREVSAGKDLLASIIDSSVCTIRVMESVRDTNNEIVDFRYQLANNSLADYKTDGHSGQLFSQVHPGRMGSDLFNRFKEVVETGNRADFEVPSEDENLDLWFRVVVVKVADGFVSTSEDITERKQTENALKDSRDMLQSVLDTTLISTCAFKAVRDKNRAITDFRIVMANKVEEGFAGRGKLDGKLYANELLDTPEGNLFEAMIRVTETGRTEYKEYYFPRDGVNSWYYSMLVKMDDGVMITSINITDRKKSEQEQFKQMELLQQTENLALTGSWEYDIQSGAFLWSDGMYNLFGMEDHAAVRPSVYVEYATEEDEAKAAGVANGIEHSFAPFEQTLRIYAGDVPKTLRIRAVPFTDGEGSRKMLGIDMDVTKVQQAQEDISALNKILMAKTRELENVYFELTTFNSIAANDYKETLHTLYTNLEFLIINDSKNLSNVGRANIRKTQSAVQKLKLLTEDIVAFSRLHTLQKTPGVVNLDQVLEKVLEDLGRKMEESNATVLRDKLPEVTGFSLLVSLLFYHLIDNGIKFRNDGTAPVVDIRYAGVVNDHHKITFRDNGIGFDQKDAVQIFSIFYRIDKHKYKGSGVGLAICKKIMDLHGGFISADSVPEEGATFNCYFPVNPML